MSTVVTLSTCLAAAVRNRVDFEHWSHPCSLHGIVGTHLPWHCSGFSEGVHGSGSSTCRWIRVEGACELASSKAPSSAPAFTWQVEEGPLSEVVEKLDNLVELGHVDNYYFYVS